GAAVAAVGDYQLAAARGPGAARADQGQPAPSGRFRPVPGGLASPADGAHGRAVAPPSGGRPPDVASQLVDLRSLQRLQTTAASRSGIRATPSVTAVITET